MPWYVVSKYGAEWACFSSFEHSGDINRVDIRYWMHWVRPADESNHNFLGNKLEHWELRHLEWEPDALHYMSNVVRMHYRVVCGTEHRTVVWHL